MTGPTFDDFMQTSAPGTAETIYTLAPGDHIDHWEVIDPVGMGGMGEVYKVRRADGNFEQIAALKIMLPSSSERLQNFETERQRLANLEHPGICRIVDGGATKDGRPFLVMEFVDGENIIQYAEHNGFLTAQKLTLFQKLCQSVEYAHRRLVLHRDLKPQNILVNRDGHLKLLDFGIAGSLEEDMRDAQSYSLDFAAPEQLKGQSLAITSDVFSLGALLHLMLSGKIPRRLKNGAMMSNGALSSDAKAIIDKCLQLDPDDRYGSVESLNQDVGSLIQKRPVIARNGGRWYRLKRLFQRTPFASGFAALALASLIGGTVVSTKFGLQSQKDAEEARKALGEAQVQYGRADAYLKGQDALNEILFDQFKEDPEALKAELKDNWQSYHSTYEKHPEKAASVALTVGRLLYQRGDTEAAQEVFKAWHDADYGTEEMKTAGLYLLAMSYYDAGDQKGALPYMRKSLEHMERTANYPAKDKYFMAFRIAQHTYLPEDIEKSTALYEEYLKEDQTEDPTEKIQQHAGTFQVRILDKDYESAERELKAILKIFRDHPDRVAPDRVRARNLLTKLNLYALEHPEEALKHADDVLSEDLPLFGESGMTVGTKIWRAESLRLLRRPDEALAQIHSAKDDATKIGVTSGAMIVALDGIRAQILSDQSQSEAAINTINEVLSVAPQDTKIILSDLFIRAQSGEDISHAGETVKKAMNLEARNDYRTFWLYNQLLEHGLPDVLSENQ